MYFLPGLLCLLGGATVVVVGLSVVWRAEQNTWLSFLGFHPNLPWYNLVGVATAGILAVFLWYVQPNSSVLALLLQIILAGVLIITFISDVHFNSINLPILAVGGVVVLVGIGFHEPWLPSLLSALVAAGIASVFFLWQYVLSRGVWVGIGDAWLGGFLGLLVGWHEILLVTAAGYGLATLAAFLFILFLKNKAINRLPLGAFLSFASLVFFIFTIIR